MSACEYVTLRGGQAVPLAVLRRLWALEERGLRFRLDDDDLLVGPRRLVDDNDRLFLRDHKAIVLSILSGEVRV
jgi:hypothetical protein